MVRCFTICVLFLAAGAAFAQGEKERHVATIDADGVQRVRIVGGSYFFKPGRIVVKANVPVEILVGYDSDPTAVEAMAMQAAREVQTSVEGAVATFQPTVRFSSFADLGLRGTVALRAKSIDDQAAVRHEFIRRLHSAFRERGIVVPTLVPPQPKGSGL